MESQPQRRKPAMRDLTATQLSADRTLDRVGDGIRILVADDERDTVMTLGILLRSSGFEVHLVQTGADALRSTAEVKPHAVLLDIGMPDRNGHDVANQLRLTHGKACPVLIALTGRAALSEAEAKSSGFDHYFQKPCDPAELLRLLGALKSEAAARSAAA